MMERFNGRVVDLLKTEGFHRHEDMRQILQGNGALYNPPFLSGGTGQRNAHERDERLTPGASGYGSQADT